MVLFNKSFKSDVVAGTIRAIVVLHVFGFASNFLTRIAAFVTLLSYYMST